MHKSGPSFVLLSACKNEAANISHCLESVYRQSLLPRVWIIVDDGSTDETVQIIESWLPKLPFLRLIKLPTGRPRCFGSKDRAIQRAYDAIRDLSFDYIGVFDTDIGLEPATYFEEIFAEFAKQPRLGVAGGAVCEEQRGVFQERAVNVPWSVAGCVQMFRRECFDQTGGFVPLEFGGSDTFMELQLRMRGWETRTIPHLRVFHYRPTSSAGGLVRGWYRAGLLAGSFGAHPIFIFVKALRRLRYKPALIGSLAFCAGFCAYRLSGRPLVIPKPVSEHLRSEQLSRLRGLRRLSPALVQKPEFRESF